MPFDGAAEAHRDAARPPSHRAQVRADILVEAAQDVVATVKHGHLATPSRAKRLANSSAI